MYTTSTEQTCAEAPPPLPCLQVKTPSGHTLWDTEHLLAKAAGKAPATMTSFQALMRKMPKPAAPIAAPASVPAPPGSLSAIEQWLWEGAGRVPSAADLKLELGENGKGSPFKVPFTCN